MQFSIGIDEVGRGALAGPVTVGAVALPGGNEKAEIIEHCILSAKIKILKDSKKHTHLQRERVALWTKAYCLCATGSASAEEIDQRGIVAATSLAATRAIDGLKLEEQIFEIVADAGILIDCPEAVTVQNFIRGDELYPEISLASIVAKKERDEYMCKIALEYPEYGFEQNVGYGTKSHLNAVINTGLSPLHRRSFCKKIVFAQP